MIYRADLEHKDPTHLALIPCYFDDKLSTVPYMLNGEIPLHWNDLVTHDSESATGEGIDIANTWAARDQY